MVQSLFFIRSRGRIRKPPFARSRPAVVGLTTLFIGLATLFIGLATLFVGALLFAGCAGCARSTTRKTAPAAHLQATGAAEPATDMTTPLGASVSPTVVAGEAAASLRTGNALAPRFGGSAARIAFDTRRWAACAAAFGDGAQYGPEAWQARALGLLCLRRAGHPADAARGFAVLASAGGLLGDHARLWAAEAWLEAGDYEQARAAAVAVKVADFARAARTKRTLGRALKALGRKQQAADVYTGLLRSVRRPAADLLQEAAAVALTAGRSADAARWLRAIRANYPGGVAEQRAIVALQELPANARKLSVAALERRMVAARVRNKRKLAMATADEVMRRTKPGSRSWCNAGTEKARVMEIFWLRRKEAAAFYDTLTTACPKNSRSAKIWFRGGRRHANSASSAAATRHFQRVIDLAPKTTLVDDSLRWQARLLRKRGKHAAADRILLRVLTLGGDMVEYAGWDLVWRRIQAKDWAGAAAMADKALATGVRARKRYNLGRVSYWKGYAEWRRHRKGAAKSAWAATIQRSPWTWYGMLARVRLRALNPAAERVAFASWRTAQPAARDLATVAAKLLRDRHLLASLELSRMGLLTSARAELAAVSWPRNSPDLAMLKAALFAAVGQRTRSVAATLADHAFDLAPPTGANAARWKLAYPRPPEFQDVVDAEAKSRGVDASFVWAIMRSESRFNPKIQSPVHATGLLQLMLGTAKGVNRRINGGYTITYPNLMKPSVNVALGVAYMSRLQHVIGDHWALVASSYNAGPGNTRKWLRKRPTDELDVFVEAIPFKENRRYVKGVLTSWSRYRALYAGDEAAALALDVPDP